MVKKTIQEDEVESILGLRSEFSRISSQETPAMEPLGSFDVLGIQIDPEISDCAK